MTARNETNTSLLPWLIRIGIAYPWLFWFSAVALSWILVVVYARLDPGRVVAWYVD